MNFFKIDSPLMNLLRSITDMLFLQLLFVIFCIPIVTIGPAITAKYYVAMKLVRNEETGILKPFVSCFTRNFKTALPIWLVELVVSFVLITDWFWIFNNGIANSSAIYVIGLAVVTLIDISVTLVVFPLISRFSMKPLEYIKAAIIVAISNFFKIALIVILAVMTIIACIWYFQWLPLIAAFMVLSLTLFLSLVLSKEFKKIEDGYTNKKTSTDEDETNLEPVDGFKEANYAGSRKDLAKIEAEEKSLEELFGPNNAYDEEERLKVDGNGIRSRIRRYYANEKANLDGLTKRQKLEYFADYYLPGLIVVIILLASLGWYISDVIKAKKVVLTGVYINCQLSDEGMKHATNDFITWGDYSSDQRVELGPTDLSFDGMTEADNASIELAFQAQVATGLIDYFIMDEEAVVRYSGLEYFADLGTIIDIEAIGEGRLFYTDEEETGSPSVPCAIRITDSAKESLGLPLEENYYVAFSIVNNKAETYSDYILYLEQ